MFRTPIPLKATLRTAAIKSVGRYLTEHASDLERTIHSESRSRSTSRLESPPTGESTRFAARHRRGRHRRLQVHSQSPGGGRHPRSAPRLRGRYQELTREHRPDRGTQPYELGKTIPELVEDTLLTAVRCRIKDAGNAPQNNDLPRLPNGITNVPNATSRRFVATCRSSEKGATRRHRALKRTRLARNVGPLWHP